MDTPEIYKKPLSPALQLFYLLVITFGFVIFVGSMVGVFAIGGIYGIDMVKQIAGINPVHSANYVAAMRLFLGLGNTVIGFWTPALVFAFYVVRKPATYLKYESSVSPVLFLYVLLFMAFFMPIIDITSYWNQQMVLPPPFKGLDQWIHHMEDQNAAVFKEVMNMPKVGDLVVTLFIVGFLPAISEEFLFRGCLQTIFRRWGMGVHVAVWFTAFIFSFIHFEFLGFVPRLLLGAGLGYLCAWSGSIWPSVFCHFLNNGFAVVVTYMSQHQQTKLDPDSNTPMFSNHLVYLFCLLISVSILIIYRRKALATNPGQDGEELD